MGVTIDNTCEPKPMSKEEIVNTLKTMVFGVQAFERFNAKERETLDKAWNIIDQYENRLKADMLAVLEDLDLLIDEFDSGCGWDGYIKKIDVHKLIQQKINDLRGEEHE